MRKPTIHFAYAVPFSRIRLRRGFERLMRMAYFTPLYRSGKDIFIPWRRPIRSPHCISYHLLAAFRAAGYPVKFYSILEHTIARMNPGDIFIGQPIPRGGFNETRPDTDEKDSVTSRTIREYPDQRTFLIMPYTHDSLYISWARDLIRDHNGGLILIGGKIWERDWEQKSPLRDIRISRKIHVEMGIDPNDYPVVKKKFNAKGKRGYLFIGHAAWYKNTKELENIAQKMPNFRFGHIGSGEIRGWKKISPFACLTPEFMSRIAEEYDIFVSTSTADPQATTILEQMCSGFVVAATPESGYEHSSLVLLSTNDTDYNVRILTELQQRDEKDLIALTQQNRRIAEQEHSWQKFCKTIFNFIGIEYVSKNERPNVPTQD